MENASTGSISFKDNAQLRALFQDVKPGDSGTLEIKVKFIDKTENEIKFEAKSYALDGAEEDAEDQSEPAPSSNMAGANTTEDQMSKLNPAQMTIGPAAMKEA